MEIPKIKLWGNEFLLVNDYTICTEHQLRNGYQGYAIIDGDEIWRHGQIVGSNEDIEHLGIVDIQLDVNDLITMLDNMIGGTGWPLDKPSM